MIFTGGKRSSAVLAACEKRRSGLAPKTTQGPGTKTESSIFGMPNQQVPPGSFLIGIVELEAREFYGEVTSVAKQRDTKPDLPASHNKPKPRTEHQ